MKRKGAILVISGPSGSGKSSLCKELFKEIDNLYFSISTTTRPPREGEVDGEHYFFVSKELFLKDIEDERFLEWAEVHGNFYGTSKDKVLEALEEGRLVIFDIDIQGFLNIYEQFGDYVTSVFITTSNQNELRERLQNRKTDSEDTINLRVAHALNEMKYIKKYDYLLINNDFQKTADELIAIAKSATLKSHLHNLDEFSKQWKSTATAT